jgi:hypothetical protein
MFLKALQQDQRTKKNQYITIREPSQSRTYIFHVKLYERLIKVVTIDDCILIITKNRMILAKQKKRQCKTNVEVTRTKKAE